MRLISQSEREGLDQILAANGYRSDDFDATAEDDPAPTHGPFFLYAIRSTITVRRKNTDQVRQYPDAPFSAWILDGFQPDLKAGLFGKPEPAGSRTEPREGRGGKTKEVDLFCANCGYKRPSQEPVAEEEKRDVERGARHVIPACPACGSRRSTYKKPKL